MKTPPLLLGACLIFWGWRTGHPLLAAGVAVILEGARWVRLRWTLELSDMIRISDLCTLIFVGLVIFLFTTTQPSLIIFVALEWTPIIFLPLMVAHNYSEPEGIDIRALSVVFRKQRYSPDRPAVRMDLTYPYAILCILSAGVANLRGPGYYIGVSILAAWGLWPVRSRRFSPITWMALILLAGVIGYGGQIGLHRLQLIIEEKGMEWFAGNGDVDPYRSVTAIGDIVDLKPSDRIRFRVRWEAGHRRPIRLREASYNRYQSGRWFALPHQFEEARERRPAAAGADVWRLGPRPPTSERLTVNAPARKGQAVLKLPTGTFEVQGLSPDRMLKNAFGAVKADDVPGLIRYTARFGPGAPIDAPPGDDDLAVPDKDDREAADAVISELRLAALSPEAAVDRLNRFFRDRFTYAIGDGEGGRRPDLAEFLRRTRRGHCEYFATATVIILRRIGIPARYAVGYLAHEYSRLEDGVVVRDRDAHAWAQAWIDGQWREVDTTPPDWTRIEAAATPAWQRGFDLLSWGGHFLSRWRWGQVEVGLHVLWLLIPLLIILVRRASISGRLRRSVGTETAAGAAPVSKLGTDSELYCVVERLEALGHPRHRGEPLGEWLRRLEAAGPRFDTEALGKMLRHHYRYRFDPEGISRAQRAELRRMAADWLRRHPPPSVEMQPRMNTNEDKPS
jgi:protein-glutamine gamma-glutamyltransferase